LKIGSMVGLANVRALRLEVAVLRLKISEKTPRLPLVGSRVLFGLDSWKEF
jgi:hypothetical protein